LRERVRVRGVLAQVKSIKIDVPYFRRNDNPSLLQLARGIW
jgi:hypothetical protein